MNYELIKVLAIDDEPLALQQLEAYIRKMPFLKLVSACQSATDALQIMQREVIDAIFIDINMPDLNGMDFVKQLAVPPLVVFTTAYSEYAVEGFRVDAVDYLLKPFGLQDFQRAAMKVKARYELQNTATVSAVTDDDVLFFKTDYKVVRIRVSDICYVEGMSEYLKIHLEGQKPIVVLLSMKKLEERLPAFVKSTKTASSWMPTPICPLATTIVRPSTAISTASSSGNKWLGDMLSGPDMSVPRTLFKTYCFHSL